MRHLAKLLRFAEHSNLSGGKTRTRMLRKTRKTRKTRRTRKTRK